MTRINSDLDPKILADQHLMAEYNEFGMFFSSLRRSLKSKKGLPKIPDRFTLNAGHVTFFYNKLAFMEDRYSRLISELKNREYNLDPDRVIFTPNEFPKYLYNEYEATDADFWVIKDRIKTRLRQKPTFYRYNREKIDVEDFISKYYEV